MRNFLIALAIVAVAGFGSIAISSPTSAQTADDIQKQIRELLLKVAELTKQLNILQGNDSSDSVSAVPPFKHRICSVIYRNLALGTTGDDVSSVQEFLREQGYLSAEATGYFGPLTANAVARWQAAEGVSAVGAFGPLSRERVKVFCGTADRFSATPQRGLAPLSVTFSYQAPGACDSTTFTRQFRIDFGDGGSALADCRGVVEHTYRTNGTYTASYIDPGGCGVNADPRCLGAPSRVIGTATIYIGSIACTKEYKPVCGSKPIVCITTPCNPIEQTYGNRCAMEADGATFLHEGQCRADWKEPADDPQCRKWTEGKACGSTCERAVAGGPIAACGSYLMKCAVPSGPPWPPPPEPSRCLEYFGTASNKPPTISSFSGPTTLAVNQSGTWTINASDPENGQLTYSVSWGDEYVPAGSNLASNAPWNYTQTTTFTHSYSSTGTYTVVMYVRDAFGKEAKTSSTVRVGDRVCPTLPPAPCPAGMSIQWHYDSNGCKVSSSCVQQPVACTMDAMLCPNGQYVGRTGPNCQFVCSSGVISAVCPSRAEDAKKKLTCPYGPIEYYTDGDGCSIPKCGTPQPGVIY